MLKGFTPTVVSYPLDATCTEITERLRLMRETSRAAVKAAANMAGGNREAGDG